ncbi:hypothetical protein ABIE44_001030 [Marmoricola sp. OAE513]|uniref:DUF2019 domain-containing protein n=1 Tax=Marmoricola sp. OAE513 TaxID=2817894 RepID=UPI001AEA85F0
MNADVERTLARYRDKAEAHAPLTTDHVRKANRLFKAMHQLAKELRSTEEGRAALLTMLDHPLPGVRMNAAAECLPFAPDAAVPVIEAIEQLGVFESLSAKYTLIGYRNGTLNMDW